MRIKQIHIHAIKRIYANIHCIMSYILFNKYLSSTYSILAAPLTHITNSYFSAIFIHILFYVLN